MTFDALIALLDWLGVAVFAASGALVASRKQMDVVGFALLATATGIGGGTVRDVLLGINPLFWVAQPAYVVACIVVGAVLFFSAHAVGSRLKLLLWLDAAGLALFAVTGTERALGAGASPLIAVLMGVVTATFGGIIRDILGGESPAILSREIYATAALVAAAAFVGLGAGGVPREVALAVAVLLGLGTRGAALATGWSLPRYRPRPGRPATGDRDG